MFSVHTHIINKAEHNPLVDIKEGLKYSPIIKMKIKQYTRQNIIQKEISNYIRLFKPEYRIIKRWEDKGIKVYTPRVNKIKFGIGLIILGVLFITPFTPELLILPKLTRWVLK